MTYQEFLQSKIDIAEETGFGVDPAEVNPALKPHQLRDGVGYLQSADNQVGMPTLFDFFDQAQ